MWTCGNCREALEDQFDACWNCGCSREGKLGLLLPDFVISAGTQVVLKVAKAVPRGERRP